MIEALRWYLALAAIGGGWILPSLLLFGRSRSGGVLYARPLALAAVPTVVWLTAALTPLPYGTVLIAFVAVLPWIWSGALWRSRPWLRTALGERIRILIAGEIVLVAVFALVLLARAQAPAAVHTEKPMDLAMLVAVHRADRMPPLDPWFAGESTSYYYLGHLGVDATARLAGVSTGTAFNLGVATAGALAGAAAFALAGDVVARSTLRRRWTPAGAGALAVVALLWVAPLEGFIEILAANGVGDAALWSRLGVEEVAGGARSGVPDEFWWWWRATRVLPGTIAEFPAFSLLLGDLHAHLLALPLGVTGLALAAQTFSGDMPQPRSWLRAPGSLLLAALLFAGMAMTNSWDVITFGAIWFASAVVAFARGGRSLLPALVAAARYIVPPALLALAFAAPFLASLDPPSIGIAPVAGEHSELGGLLLIWLAPLLPVAMAIGMPWEGGRPRPAGRPAAFALLVGLAVVAAWALALLLGGTAGELADRGTGWLTLIVLAVATSLGAGMAAESDRRRERGVAAALALVSVAPVLVLLTELVRIDDAFPGRLNTVFKLWFHAWMILAVGGAALLALALDRLPAPAALLRSPSRPLALVGVLTAALLYAGSLLYAPAMAASRAREGQQPGIDAIAGATNADPGLAAAVEWAREQLHPRRHTLLQAVAPSYSRGNLLSAASGVPTLLGWPNHERQWRGAHERVVEREAAVDRVYGGGRDALEAARRWDVTHIYVGREERERYGPSVAERFDGWPVVFDANGARILRVPAEGGP